MMNRNEANEANASKIKQNEAYALRLKQNEAKEAVNVNVNGNGNVFYKWINGIFLDKPTNDSGSHYV